MLTKHKHVYFFNVSTTNHVGEEGCELLKVGVGVLHPLPVDGRDVDEEVSDGGHRGAVLLYTLPHSQNKKGEKWLQQKNKLQFLMLKKN